PVEMRVVLRVVDDEAGVEPEAAVLERVDVPAGPRIALEYLDSVRARQQVGGAEPRHARSDHGDPHRTAIRPAANIGCREPSVHCAPRWRSPRSNASRSAPSAPGPASSARP